MQFCQFLLKSIKKQTNHKQNLFYSVHFQNAESVLLEELKVFYLVFNKDLRCKLVSGCLETSYINVYIHAVHNLVVLSNIF